MNKKTIITILLALVAMAGQGQEIKKVAATPEDFMESAQRNRPFCVLR